MTNRDALRRWDTPCELNGGGLAGLDDPFHATASHTVVIELLIDDEPELASLRLCTGCWARHFPGQGLSGVHFGVALKGVEQNKAAA